MTATAPAPALARPSNLFRMQETGLLLVIILLYIALTIAGLQFPGRDGVNGFLNPDNQLNGIATNMSMYAIMAVGMTCIIITGGIDISVGAILGLSALTGATVLQFLPVDAPWYVSVPVALFVPLLVGGLCGLANGTMIVALRVHPFIITLGTLSIIRGLCVLLFPASVPWEDRSFPNSFMQVMDWGFRIGEGRPLRPVPAIVMLIVVGLGAMFLHFMVAGRETYAVGGNAEAARFSGIRVWWVTVRVYLIMGLCCGVAAFVLLGRFFSASSNEGTGAELRVIAAAVVGGASLTGGRGTALGLLLGTWIIYLIINGIDVMHLNSRLTEIILGASIIIAVTIDRYTQHLRKQNP